MLAWEEELRGNPFVLEALLDAPEKVGSKANELLVDISALRRWLRDKKERGVNRGN